MKMIKCKNCGKIYLESMKKCPICFTKTPLSTARKLIIAIVLFIGVVCLLVASAFWNDSNKVGDDTYTSAPSSDASSQEVSKATVNYENFEKIKTGMSYNQVVEIFGKEGKIMSETDIGMGEEYKTTIYCWYDYTGIANCNVTIQGGKVVAKAQAGLR